MDKSYKDLDAERIKKTAAFNAAAAAGNKGLAGSLLTELEGLIGKMDKLAVAAQDIQVKMNALNDQIQEFHANHSGDLGNENAPPKLPVLSDGFQRVIDSLPPITLPSIELPSPFEVLS